MKNRASVLVAWCVVACGGADTSSLLSSTSTSSGGSSSDAGDVADVGASTSSSGGELGTGGAKTSTGGELAAGGAKASTGGASSSGEDAGVGYGTTDGKECNGPATNCKLTPICRQYPTLYAPCCRADHRCGCEIDPAVYECVLY